MYGNEDGNEGEAVGAVYRHLKEEDRVEMKATRKVGC